MNNSSNRQISRNRNEKCVQKIVSAKYENALHPSRLRIARIERQKSQEDLAESVGLSYTTYGDIERGKRLVKKERAEQIAEALSRKLNDLFEKKEKKYLARK